MTANAKMDGMRRMTTMSGKTNTFKESFEHQVSFQKLVTGAKCPGDNLEQFSYHIQAMVEELGEVVKADKRWKTHRNERYLVEEKLDEIADVFITAMNIAIHSGFSSDDIEKSIMDKIQTNYERLHEATEKEKIK